MTPEELMAMQTAGDLEAELKMTIHLDMGKHNWAYVVRCTHCGVVKQYEPTDRASSICPHHDIPDAYEDHWILVNPGLGQTLLAL